MTYQHRRINDTQDPLRGGERRAAPIPELKTPIESGTLKFFNTEKGYGFIVTDQGDLFVHISAFQRVGLDVPEKGTPLRFQRGFSRDQRELALAIHP